MAALIAFDTATERMTIAVAHAGGVWAHADEGGARASSLLIPAILDLLKRAGLRLADLDAIAFGRGPGAFTGLRTACSVAQGLAFGAAKPVLPIDSLLAIAEEARAGRPTYRAWALLDARMAQIYAAEYAFGGDRWSTVVAPMLTDAEALATRWRHEPPQAVAGQAARLFGDRPLPVGAELADSAAPGAIALLGVAGRDFADGLGVDAALALPLYVRDKVAETTAERLATRERRDAAARAAS